MPGGAYKKKCPTFRRAGSSVVTSTPDYLAYRAPSGFRLRVSRQTYRSGHSPTLWGQQAFLLDFPAPSGSFRSPTFIPRDWGATPCYFVRMARSRFAYAVGFWCHRASLALSAGKPPPTWVSLHFLDLLQHTFFQLSRLFFIFLAPSFSFLGNGTDFHKPFQGLIRSYHAMIDELLPCLFAVVWHPPSGLFGIPRPLRISAESEPLAVSTQVTRQGPLSVALLRALPDFYTAQGAG